MDRVALVVSGGSAKGAFAVGAAGRLRDQYNVPRFDVVSGTSTGAIMAPFAVLDRFTELEALYTSFGTANVFVRLNDALDIFRNGYLLNTEPLRGFLTQTYTPQLFADLLQAGDQGRQMSVTAVNMQTGRVAHFFTGPEPETDPDR
jgi:NTE family protein